MNAPVPTHSVRNAKSFNAKSALLASAEPLARHLESCTSARTVFPLGVSKHLALTALFLMADRGFDGKQAVEAARTLFDDVPSIAPSTLKKCASEAHALVAHMVDLGAWTPSIWRPLNGAGARLAHLEAIVAEASLRAALEARAMALGGAKGGRPRKGAPEDGCSIRALDAVLNAMRSAAQGDPAAVAELNSVRALLNLNA